MSKTVQFQIIQFGLQKQFHFLKLSLAYIHSLNIKTVLFQAIQFSQSTEFSYISPIDSTLSGATTPDPSRPGRNDNKGVLSIPQNSSITGTSPSECIESYLDT